MTAEEELIESINGWFDDGDGRFFFSEEDKNRIVNALEKQVPKKPIVNGNRNPDWDEEADLCPECLNYVGWCKYCEHCGQRLDWEG